MKILKPFFHAGALRRPGDEQALADTKPTDEQIEGWVKRELIESEGVTVAPDAPLSSKELDELARVLLPMIDENNEGEGLVDVVKRVILERDDSHDDNDNLLEELKEANARIGELQTELESLRGSQTPATPNGDSVVDINKTLEAGELSEIVGAPAALSLLQAGFDTRAKIIEAPDKTLTDLPEVGIKSVEKLRTAFEA